MNTKTFNKLDKLLFKRNFLQINRSRGHEQQPSKSTLTIHQVQRVSVIALIFLLSSLLPLLTPPAARAVVEPEHGGAARELHQQRRRERQHRHRQHHLQGLRCIHRRLQIQDPTRGASLRSFDVPKVQCLLISNKVRRHHHKYLGLRHGCRVDVNTRTFK